MCSRVCKKQPNLTESPKPRKNKTNEMIYSTSYSKSWAGPTQSERKKAKKILDSAQKLPKREMSPKLKNSAPDPAVHHLKYGLFPQKVSRTKVRVLSPRSRVLKHELDVPEQNKDGITEGESTTPYFMVSSLDTHLTKRLSRTASTHLDIKPRNP